MLPIHLSSIPDFPVMTHEKAIELLIDLHRNVESALSLEQKLAINHAIAALLSEKLYLLREY